MGLYSNEIDVRRGRIMEEYFEKLFYWEEFLNICTDKKNCYIGNKSNEPRADNDKKIKELSKNCSCMQILLEYDYDTDSFFYNGERYSLKFQTRNIIDELDKNVPLMLNITSLNLRLLGTLLFHIKKLKFKKVYCVYTEPLRYCKTKISDKEKNGEEYEEEYVDRFDLYKKFRGIEAIPGFLRENDENLSERWIAFLGFEGKRLEQIHEKYEFDNIVPVITLPSYQPGWHNYVFDENLDLIKKADRKPEYIIANSFMSAYNYLQKVVQATPDLYIRVSPLGTKINALGALLFSLNNTKSVEILYDNPIEEGSISKDCGKTYVFDISEVINQ